MSLMLAVDLSNVVHRSMHGYGQMADSVGRPLGAAHGLGTVIWRLREKYGATHVVACRDGARSALRRREIDPAYKEHREGMDPALAERLRLSWQRADQVLRAFGVEVVGADGAEADDICASYGRTFPGRVVIATGDRDLLGAITRDGRVGVHLLGKVNHLVGWESATQIMGVTPDRIADYKALVGDASDGFSGVTGIGPKGAVALIERYGSLDEILARVEELPGRARQLVGAGVDDARRCYRLAQLDEGLILPVPAPWVAPADLAERLEALDLIELAGRVRGRSGQVRHMGGRTLVLPPDSALAA